MMKRNFHLAIQKRLISAVVCLTIILAGATYVNGTAAQQPRRSNIESEGEKETTAAKPKASGTTRPRAKVEKARPRNGNSEPAPGTPPTEHSLTFVTGVAETDIIIDGTKVGTTGPDGRLTAKVKTGKQHIVASHPQYREAARPVDVKPGLREIIFYLEKTTRPVVLKEPVAAAAPPPAEPEPPPKPTPSADSIIKRFLDSKETTSVSVDDWNEVLSQTEKALAQEPNNKQLKSRRLFAYGQIAYLRGEYTIALVAFNDSAQTQPDSALAHYGVGNAYLVNNLLPEAVRSYQRAIQLLPAFALAHKALGDALTKLNNNREAIASYQQAIQYGYPATDLKLNIARTLMKEQRWSMVLDELKSVAEKDPSAEVYLLMGESYEALRNHFSAALAYNKAAELDRNSATAHYRLGLLLYGLREYGGAKDALDRAVVLDPKGEKINSQDARKKAEEAGSKANKQGKRKSFFWPTGK